MRGRKPFSLSRKLILGMMLFAVVGLGVAFFFVNTLVQDIVYENVLESTVRDRRIQARQVDAWFRETGNIVETLAETLPLVDRHYYQEIVTHLLSVYDYVQSIWVALEDGGFYDSAFWVPPYWFIVPERPWWVAAEAVSGNVAITLPFLSAETDEIIVTFAQHVRDWGGQEGVIAMNIEREQFEFMVNNFQLGADGYLLIFGPGGEIIFHPNPMYLPTLDGLHKMSDLNEYARVFADFEAGATVVSHVCRYGIPSYFVQFPLPSTGWTFVSVIPTTVASTPVWQILSSVILTISIVLVLVFALSFVFISLSAAQEKEYQRLELSEESNRAKSRFLARMSHEIRTPISAVLGLSEIQLRNQVMSPQTEEAFAKIYDSSKMLLNIVNDILDLSKIESGKMTLVNNEYDVASLVNDVAQLQVVYSERKDVAFKMRVDESLPAKLIGDILRIRQIISNLLSNAFKYTESGTIKLFLHCERSEENDKHMILIISIQDTGIGMSAKQMDELKGEYVRLHEQEKPFVSGTGLGIPIVYSLAQIMGAQFDLKSEVGKGTHATVRIPQEVLGVEVLGRELAESLQNFESKSRASAKNLEFVPTSMPHGKVLVVDDVEINLHVAEAMLESFGLEIELCESGISAVDKIKQGNAYDVIFMDHMMPDMDGVEATKILRDMGYDKPIVALTANAIKGQAEMFMNNGFSGFMAKPIDIKLLNSYLMRFISP